MSRSTAILRCLLAVYLLLGPYALTAQESMGIGTDSPDAQSILDIRSSDRGILIPRMTTTERNAIGQSAADVGLLIYNTTDSLFNYWDGVQWLPFPAMLSGDADWYIEGTSTLPSAITDDIYHSGNVAIGKNTADVQLDVESSGTADGAVRVNHTGTGNDPIVLEVDDAGNATGTHTGADIDMGGTHDEEIRGTHVSLSNTGDGLKYGHRVDLNDNGNGNKFAYATYITPSGGGSLFGSYTFANGTLNSTLTGYQLSSSQAGNGNAYGGFMNIAGNLTGLKVGMRTWIQGGGNGTHYGTWNVLTNNWGNGTKYGTSNSISDGTNSPLGDKYGTYNSVRSDNGTLYGTYNSVGADDGGGTNTKYAGYFSANGDAAFNIGIYAWAYSGTANFAGYFNGNLAVGTTNFTSGTPDYYIFPPSRGTADQVMQTDGSGNVSWVDPGDLSDDDWTRDTVNGYLFPATLSDSVGIGTNTPSARLDVTDSNVGTGVSFSLTDALSSSGAFQNLVESNSAGPFTGILNSLVLNENATGEKTAIHNLVNYASANGPSGTKTGLFNDLTSESGEVYGVRNEYNLTDRTNTDWTYGTYNEWAPNSGRTYGTYNLFQQTGGTSGGARIYGTRTQIVNTNPDAGISGAYRVLGEYNDIEANGNGFVWGQYNRIFGDFNANYLVSGTVYGTENAVFADSANRAYGTRNTIFGDGLGSMFGTYNNISSLGFAYVAKHGTYNLIGADQNEDIYGTTNEVSNLGSGDSYGVYSDVFAGVGTAYGVFSQATDLVNDYAGFFEGRVFIGDDAFPTPDGYILPIGDGTAGQVIETDGAGNASWADPDDGDWDRDAGNGYLYPATIGDEVGIGTATPATSLHVDHPTGNTNGLSISNATDADRWHLYMWSSNTLRLYYNGGEVGSFDNASGTYTATSDARLKEDVKSAEPVLDRLLRLRPVSYRFTGQQGGRRYVGLLAQDVEQLFPHLVYHTPASEENGMRDNYSMDYSGFGVLAVKAIQEQQELIEKKDARIESLEGRVQDLAERLAALEARMD